GRNEDPNDTGNTGIKYCGWQIPPRDRNHDHGGRHRRGQSSQIKYPHPQIGIFYTEYFNQQQDHQWKNKKGGRLNQQMQSPVGKTLDYIPGAKLNSIKEEYKGNAVIRQGMKWYNTFIGAPFRKKISQQNTGKKQKKKCVDA